MSHAVVFVATPTLGAAAVMGGVVALAGYGSYIAIQKLRQDYQESLAMFQQRCATDQLSRVQFTEQEQTATAAALALAGQTQVQATEDATRKFLYAQIGQLVARLPQLPKPDPDLQAMCLSLRQAVDEHPEDVVSHFEQYRQLWDRLATALAANATTLKGSLADEIAAVRDDLQSPLLSEVAYAELRAQWQDQLDSLAGMGKRQPGVANQGLTLLRQRIHRELRRQAERQQARRQQADEFRTMVGEMLAKLQAVAGQHQLPELAGQAVVLLGQLGEKLAHATTEDQAQLRQLAQTAEALFTLCEKTLEEQAISEYLGDQIADVLLTMGYQVSQVAPEGSNRKVLASVGDDIGVEFHVKGDGRMGAQMVALSEQASATGQAHEAKVCALVDDVLTALRTRQCQVQERFRSHLAEGEDLRVVDVPATQIPVAHAAKAQKQMQVEQPR